MTKGPKPASVEGFLAWLAQDEPWATKSVEPPDEVLKVAVETCESTQALRSSAEVDVIARIRAGRFREQVELLAAADREPNRRLPRLRTDSCFVITPRYRLNSTPGEPPVGLLVECPPDLIDSLQGLSPYFLIGPEQLRVELGQFDAGGKSTGDLPSTLEFKVPIIFVVADREEPASPDEPQSSEDGR